MHGQKTPLTLQWTGQIKRNEPNSEIIRINISGRDRNIQYRLENVRTVSHLMLPIQSLNYEALKDRFPHLKGLPLQNYTHAQPKLLIGLDNIRLGVPLKLREGRPTEPIAAMCRLGWSIYGGGKVNPTQTAMVNFHVASPSDCDKQMNEQLREYFTLEDYGTKGSFGNLDSEDDIRSNRLLTETTRRIYTGERFETGLLWNTDHPNFPDSYPMAVRRLEALE